MHDASIVDIYEAEVDETNDAVGAEMRDATIEDVDDAATNEQLDSALDVSSDAALNSDAGINETETDSDAGIPPTFPVNEGYECSSRGSAPVKLPLGLLILVSLMMSKRRWRMS